MTSIKEQILTDSKGKKVAIVLPFHEYEKLIQALEELEDIRDYDQFIANPEPIIPLREAIKMRN